MDPFYWGGLFFIVCELFILSALLPNPDLRIFLFWSCNNFCILLAIACFRRNMQMVMGVSYLGLVTQLFWISDFTSSWVGFNISGISDYIYEEGFTYANDVSIFVHLIIPIVILAFTFKVKPALRSLIYAFIYTIAIYVISFVFTPPIEDINCIFNGCGNGQYVPYNTYLWLFYASVSVLGSYLIHLFIYYGWRLFKDKGKLFVSVFKIHWWWIAAYLICCVVNYFYLWITRNEFY